MLILPPCIPPPARCPTQGNASIKTIKTIVIGRPDISVPPYNLHDASISFLDAI